MWYTFIAGACFSIRSMIGFYLQLQLSLHGPGTLTIFGLKLQIGDDFSNLPSIIFLCTSVILFAISFAIKEIQKAHNMTLTLNCLGCKPENEPEKD